MSIKVENVTKFYGRQKALDNVSFEIKSGDIVGFLGPNGAGKSTIMKIITGFISLNSGVILVNGYNIDIQSIESRRCIGYLPENNPLYHEMYIREYLEFVAGAYKLGRKTKKRVDEMLELTGLQDEQNKKVGVLSKGYRQRVGLAQALIHDPQVLILDEPTSGLDPNQIIEIRNLISEVGKEKTVMLSTHIMQEVEAICDKIIIINKGRIIANDTTESIHSLSLSEVQTILVEFNKHVDAEELRKINGVIEVTEHKENKWIINGKTESDLRTEIFYFAVNKQLVLLSMVKQEKTIENVFHELTFGK